MVFSVFTILLKHGYALEMLKDKLQPGMKALDIGSGSGYLTACMAYMVGPTGRAIGIEHAPDLVKMSKRNIDKISEEYLKEGRVKLIESDGRNGCLEEAPFDCIHVGAAADDVPKKVIGRIHVCECL
jgi:protein-L-isoaspartate(D-aspartate) O-methyltransferase